MQMVWSGVLYSLLSAAGLQNSQGSSPWLEYDQARQVARKAGKPIFLVFR